MRSAFRCCAQWLPLQPCMIPVLCLCTLRLHWQSTGVQPPQSSGGNEGVKSSLSVSPGFLNIFSTKSTWTETDTVTRTNTWLETLATTQTVANTFPLKSDSPSYATDQFVVNQDSTYGTFMFNTFQ